MKPRKPPRREIFVLTPEEKRAVVVVVGAFLLGLGTMHYRTSHPRTPPPPTVKQPPAKKRSSTSLKKGSPIPSPTPTAPRHEPPGMDEE